MYTSLCFFSFFFLRDQCCLLFYFTVWCVLVVSVFVLCLVPNVASVSGLSILIKSFVCWYHHWIERTIFLICWLSTSCQLSRHGSRIRPISKSCSTNNIKTLPHFTWISKCFGIECTSWGLRLSERHRVTKLYNYVFIWGSYHFLTLNNVTCYASFISDGPRLLRSSVILLLPLFTNYVVWISN
jgi:hypothetical protein